MAVVMNACQMVFQFECYMSDGVDRQEFDMELIDYYHTIRFQRREDDKSSFPHGRWETINETLYVWVNFNGPEFPTTFFAVSKRMDGDGQLVMEGYDGEERRICMRPKLAERNGSVEEDAVNIIDSLLGKSLTLCSAESRRPYYHCAIGWE